MSDITVVLPNGGTVTVKAGSRAAAALTRMFPQVADEAPVAVSEPSEPAEEPLPDCDCEVCEGDC